MAGWKNGSRVEWDDAIPPAELLAMVAYLLRKNGRAAIFAQEPYTAGLVLAGVPTIPFGFRGIWKKNSPGICLGAKKAPVSYFEDICFFSRTHPKHDTEGMDPSRPYFEALQAQIGKSLKQINADFGHRKLEHTFYHPSTQFLLCGRDLYVELVDKYDLWEWEHLQAWDDLDAQSRAFRENLVRSMNEDFPSVFNLPDGAKSRSNVFEYAKDTDVRIHPTQKPVALLADLIELYSRPDDLVVDFTAGSMSTGVACHHTGRRFVGIERDPDIYRSGLERLHWLPDWGAK
jgi:site-specific DNA-methyltransferase (adenine-specific)